MSYEIVFTMAVIVAVLVALATNRLPADVTLVAAMLAVVLGGIITPEQALAGFSNTGLMVVAVLYVVAAALRDTGAIYWVVQNLLGRPKSHSGSLVRLIFPVGLLSAFLNNTTVVAMLIPAVKEWSKRLNLPASKLLLPLSYAAILGGTCTLIGTSTNLVVNGLMQTHHLPSMGLFDLAWVGVPVIFAGGLIMIFFGRLLLPSRQGLVQQLQQSREYRVAMQVPANSPRAGKSIQQIGLHRLAHGRLSEIVRGGETQSDITPELRLQAGDKLAFIGAPECARELQHVYGLVPAHGQAQKLSLSPHQRCLVEVVVGPGFPGLNKTVRQGAFRTRYQAAILSISRAGERLSQPVAETVIRLGDTLLLEASDSFVQQYRYRRDFLLVSPLKDSSPPNFHKAPLAIAILLGMVVINVLGLLDILQAVFLAGGLFLATGCVTTTRARQNISINLPVLVVIGASFALGAAVQESGAADWLMYAMLSQVHNAPMLALIGIYVITVLVTEMITNNAAAVLVFPLATSIAAQLGVSPMPFIVAVMIAASASFLTPIGYQTNLMVMGPGGYRFTDYLKLGLPISILTAIISLTIIPQVWAF